MKYAVNSEEMKKIDEYTVLNIQIPALDLMERAAEAVVAVMKRRLRKEDRILAVCGPGNNGGDGVAAGRILFLEGYHVAILFIGEEDKASASMMFQLEKARNLGIPIENSNKLYEYNIIIDAIFGVGLSRPVSGTFKNVIEEINRKDNIVYAVDIPSGISADNGKVMDAAIRADYTITFGYMKQGLLLYPGVEYTGEATVADIGFPVEAREHVKPSAVYYDSLDLNQLPTRKSYSNKGTYGRVLVIAGSKGMSGAAFLSAKAAYRAGAGLVKILTSKHNRIILQTSLPEALFSSYDEEEQNTKERQQKILDDIRWASVIIIGPGLGQSETAEDLLDLVIHYAEVPVIIDADAINLLARKLDHEICMEYNQNSGSSKAQALQIFSDSGLKHRIGVLSSLLKEQTILTPHLMELSRLTGIAVHGIADNLIDTASQCSYNNKLIYAIKDARTIVTQGDLRYINVSGNNGMATGGSGDVLTGIIGALIAQGMKAFEAVCLAVYIHGLAGDEAAKDVGTYSMMASDIVNSIEKVVRHGERQE